MPHNYVPTPHTAQAGQQPQVGQWAIYEAQNGDKYPGIISGVNGPLPNGNVGVVFIRVEPNASQLAADPSQLGNPASFKLDGWQYNVAEGRIYWCPCQPPDPSLKCPPA